MVQLTPFFDEVVGYVEDFEILHALYSLQFLY